MSPEKFKTPSEDDRLLYERWLEGEGKKDVADVEFEAMLANYNIEIAKTSKQFLEIKQQLEQAGWKKKSTVSLNLKVDFTEALREEIGNLNYKVIVWDKTAFVFVAKGAEEGIEDEYVKRQIQGGFDYLGSWNSRSEVPPSIEQTRGVQIVEKYGKVFAFKEARKDEHNEDPDAMV
jgi:hypothetical protein